MKQLLLLFILPILLSLNACRTSAKKVELKSDTLLESKFAILTNKVLTDSATLNFRLDTLTNFSWDSVFILTPYYPIENMEKNMKIDLADLKKTRIVSDEVSNVLAFIKDGELINFVDLPRDKGDFRNIPSNIIFTKDNCIFELKMTNFKNGSGQQIVEAKPIRAN